MYSSTIPLDRYQLYRMLDQCDQDDLKIRYWKRFNTIKCSLFAGLSYTPIMIPLYSLQIFLQVLLGSPDYNGTLTFDERHMKNNEYTVYTLKQYQHGLQLRRQFDLDRNMNSYYLYIPCLCNALLTHCYRQSILKISRPALLTIRCGFYAILIGVLFKNYKTTFLYDRNERLRCRIKELQTLENNQ
jgi:hypothetical protein